MDLEDDIFGGSPAPMVRSGYHPVNATNLFGEVPEQRQEAFTIPAVQAPLVPTVQKPVRVSKALQDDEMDSIFYGGMCNPSFP